jgi:hypothetical protein
LPGIAGGAIGASASDEHPIAGGLAGAALGAGAGLGVLGLKNRAAYKNLLMATKSKRDTSKSESTWLKRLNALGEPLEKAKAELRDAEMTFARHGDDINSVPPDELLSHAAKTLNLSNIATAKSNAYQNLKKDIFTTGHNLLGATHKKELALQNYADALKRFPGKY